MKNLAFVAIERAHAVIDWWVREGPVMVRLSGAGVVALGGFLAYACAPGRRAGLTRRVRRRTL